MDYDKIAVDALAAGCEQLNAQHEGLASKPFDTLIWASIAASLIDIAGILAHRRPAALPDAVLSALYPPITITPDA